MAETDPPRRTPTVLWLMLGLVVVVIFAGVVFLLHGHVTPGAVGPPAGKP